MLVTIAMTGCRYRNEASDSSASATSQSLPPRCAFVLLAVSWPPIT